MSWSTTLRKLGYSGAILSILSPSIEAQSITTVGPSAAQSKSRRMPSIVLDWYVTEVSSVALH